MFLASLEDPRLTVHLQPLISSICCTGLTYTRQELGHATLTRLDPNLACKSEHRRTHVPRASEPCCGVGCLASSQKMSLGAPLSCAAGLEHGGWENLGGSSWVLSDADTAQGLGQCK